MKIRYMALVALLAAACGKTDNAAPEALQLPEEGGYLVQLQKRDSVLIADQLRYGFRVRGVIEGDPFQPLPEKPEQPGIRFIGDWHIDTLQTRSEGGLQVSDLDAYLILTSFDEGSYELLPLGAVTAFDTLSFDSRTLEVKNCPVDTAKFAPGTLYIPATDPVRFPWSTAAKWRFAGFIAGLVLAGAALAFGLWRLIRRLLHRGGAAAEEQEPAHLRALRKIDSYRDDKYWKPENQKTFYSGITDALKEYIGQHYGFDAPEMTSGEVLQALRKEKDLPAELRTGLGHLFEVADFVKFAKHTVGREETATVVPFATGFVTTTWQQELESAMSGEVEKSKKEAEQ